MALTFARRTLLPGFALALALLPACGQAVAGKAPAKATADVVAAEDLSQLDAPAIADVEVAPDTQALPVDVSEGTVSVHTAYSTLIPPPLAVDCTASVAGVEVTAECAWTASPPEVCALVSPHAVRKMGDGTCTITCALPSGASGSKSLVAKRQSVLYEFGGETVPYEMASKVVRFRVSDNAWDDDVALLPIPAMSLPKPGNVLAGPTAIDAGGSILLVGGFQVLPTGTMYQNACPGVDQAKAVAQHGCGQIWRFDLSTGTWTLVTALPANRYMSHVLQLGQTAYVMGGGATDASDTLMPYAFTLSLPDSILTELPENVMAPLKNQTPDLVPWKGGILAIAYKAATWWLKPDGALEAIDLGLSPNLSNFFQVPGVPADLFASVAAGQQEVPCLASSTQSIAEGIQFWRLDAGKWTSAAGFCMHSGFRFVVGPDAVIAAPDMVVAEESASSPDLPFDNVHRLAAPATKWEELAPITHWRFEYGAVVVQQ